MKKYLIYLAVVNFVFANSVIDTNFYDNLFNSLAQTRQGLSEESIKSLKNPFPTKSDELIGNLGGNGTSYNLVGIFGDRAKINDGWYKIGDSIDGYNLKEINDSEVILENDSKQIKLKLKQGNKNVSITYK